MYDLAYYEGMLRDYSKTAEDICKIRWNFVAEIRPRIVLDYGCGIGWFRAFRPDGVVVDSFDIADYPQTGIRRIDYDLICFWDVLEHLPNFEVIADLLANANYVAVTVPIKPKNVALEKWKHFKPGEHLHYFTEKDLDSFFKEYNYKKLKRGYPECPPRQDILSALYERRKNAL